MICRSDDAAPPARKSTRTREDHSASARSISARAWSAATFAVSLSYIVSRYLMNIEWQFDAIPALAGVLVTALLVTIVGVAVTSTVRAMDSSC